MTGCFSQVLTFLLSCFWQKREAKCKTCTVHTTQFVDAKEPIAERPKCEETQTSITKIGLRPEHSEESFQRKTDVTARSHSAKERYCLPGVSLLCEAEGEQTQKAGHGHSISAPVITSRDAFMKTYDEVCHLSDGGFGSVYSGVRKDNGFTVAIKHISAERVRRVQLEIQNELYLLPLEVHLMQMAAGGEPKPKGIVQLLDWYDLPDELILVMEKPPMCMDLCDFILAKGGYLQEREAKDIMKQLVQAVLHIHRRGVLHRDIKPDNVLVETGSELLRVRLIDFGCACVEQEEPCYEICVGPESAPPEWYVTSSYHGMPFTVWQLGVVLFAMVCGSYPFHTPREVVNAQLVFFRDVSKKCHDLLQQTLAKRPEERATLEDILQHPFLVD